MEALEASVTEQGARVRALKEAGASKDELAGYLNQLLFAKIALHEAQAAAEGKSTDDNVLKISVKLLKDLVKGLTSAKAPKVEIDSATARLEAAKAGAPPSAKVSPAAGEPPTVAKVKGSKKVVKAHTLSPAAGEPPTVAKVEGSKKKAVPAKVPQDEQIFEGEDWAAYAQRVAKQPSSSFSSSSLTSSFPSSPDLSEYRARAEEAERRIAALTEIFDKYLLVGGASSSSLRSSGPCGKTGCTCGPGCNCGADCKCSGCGAAPSTPSVVGIDWLAGVQQKAVTIKAATPTAGYPGTFWVDASVARLTRWASAGQSASDWNFLTQELLPLFGANNSEGRALALLLSPDAPTTEEPKDKQAAKKQSRKGDDTNQQGTGIESQKAQKGGDKVAKQKGGDKANDVVKAGKQTGDKSEADKSQKGRKEGGEQKGEGGNNKKGDKKSPVAGEQKPKKGVSEKGGKQAEEKLVGVPAKEWKEIDKEGGKKGQDLQGMAAFGCAFFHAAIDTANGEQHKLDIVLAAMNRPVDPEAEERRGGAGEVGKIIVSSGEQNLALLCHVPKALQEEKKDVFDMKEWFAACCSKVGAKLVEETDEILRANLPADPDNNIFPIKLKDDAIGAGYAYLVSKQLVVDEDDGDQEDFAADAGVSWAKAGAAY